VLPEDSEYDAERLIWNGMLDKRPAAIAKCTGVGDVVATLAFARERNIPFTVAGGRHDAMGNSLADGVLALDLGPIQGVHVDPVDRRAVVQPGCKWQIVDRETQLHGLAVTGGTNSDTGVAGLTLGGGIGYLMRKHGATADNLLSMQAVTVDGELIRISPDENAELFWGMCGAGANFAIVTSFEFQLHRVGPAVVGGPLVVPADRAREALRHWRDFMDSAPDEVSTMAFLMRQPRLPTVPEEWWGKPVALLSMLYIGEPARAAEVLGPLRDSVRPAADLCRETTYAEIQRGTPHEQLFIGKTEEDPGWRPRFYEKGGYLKKMSDEFIDVLVNSFEGAPEQTGEATPIFILMRMGGAVDRVPDDTMAFSRGGAYWWEVDALWESPADDDRFRSWVGETHETLSRYAAPESYINLTMSDGIEYLRRAYGPAKYDRLVELKKKWDPQNLLRFNRNIAPA
jgi:FAD/FMN-containing dehydrogenase